MEDKFYVAGVAVGLLFAAVLAVIQKTKKKKEYDERQYLARGRGFQYAFFTLMFYDMIYGGAYAGEEPGWCDNTTGIFIGILLSLVVFGVYCIWNDAYMNLRQSPRSVALFFGGIGIMNLTIGIGAFLDGRAYADGKLRFPSINLFLGVMSLLMLLLFAVRMHSDSAE